MGIHSFLKVEKGDPDWQFSPEQYFGKEFKIIDASSIELAEGVKDLMVLRQNPTDKGMLAKNIRIQSRKHSHMDLVVINEADAKLQQIFIYDVHLCEGSTINFGIFAKGGKFNKHIIQVSLEEDSNFSAYGLITNNCGGDTEVITKIIHRHPGSLSRQFILGNAGQGSQTVVQTMAILEEDADSCEAGFENLNLISGPNGRCFSKPDFILNCDCAKTSIGGITDTLSPEKIYYLQSRGLSPEQAQKTIIDNFQNQAINLIVYPQLKDEIQQLFQQ